MALFTIYCIDRMGKIYYNIYNNMYINPDLNKIYKPFNGREEFSIIKIIGDKYPTISCYPEYGLIFSLIENDCNPWILNNFLQIRLIPKWENFLTFDNHDQLLSQCPLFTYTSIPSYDINRSYENMIDFVTKSINEEKCLYVYVDRFYIKKLSEYARFHFIHRMFIIGYDMENEELYIADNFTNGRYEVITCTFDEFKNAFHRDEPRFLRDDILERDYHGDIIKYAIDIINSANSVIVFADRYYIKNLNTSYHMTHELEFNGYSLEKNEFYLIVDYGVDSKTLACKFEDLKEAYRKDPKRGCINDIGLISKKHSAVTDTLNMEQIINGLESYIYSKPSYGVEGNYVCYFGMEAIEYLLKYVTEHKEIRLRTFQFMYEHKVIMELRVRHLINSGVLEENDICIEDYIDLKKNFLNLRNSVIKYSVLNNQNNIDHLIRQFQNAVKYDRECCLKLIGALKRKSALN